MRRHPYVIALSGLVVGIAGGFFSARMVTSIPTKNADIVREGGYQYINPLISCGVSEDTPYPGFSALQKELQKQSDSLISGGQAKRISVYFRDMDQGYWTGVRTNDLFAPASLMKVPILMAYLKASQTDTQLLKTYLPLTVSGDLNANEYFKPATPLAIGKSYTIQNLLSAMIEGSDNNAAYVLTKDVNTTALGTIYEDSSIPPVVDETADAISPQNYMGFFRVLYNSALLGKARSQTALEMLGKTEFQGGIVAGMPVGTPVVHKFGERTIETINSQTGVTKVEKRELHDCGIVYYQGHPYGICVMTEGTDFTTLQKAIAAISKTAYASVADGLLTQ